MTERTDAYETDKLYRQFYKATSAVVAVFIITVIRLCGRACVVYHTQHGVADRVDGVIAVKTHYGRFRGSMRSMVCFVLSTAMFADTVVYRRLVGLRHAAFDRDSRILGDRSWHE